MPLVVPRAESMQFTGDNATEMLAFANGAGTVNQDGDLILDEYPSPLPVGWWIVRFPFFSELRTDVEYQQQYLELP
jgi:hypothetical protein